MLDRPTVFGRSEAAWRFGIEFEYLLVTAQTGAVRDFTDLDFATLTAALADPPGRTDPSLETGDLGIKSGYWYLEGDERFDPTGHLTDLLVKGVEIRTPPRPTIAAAIDSLTDVETQLLSRLARAGLGAGIVGHNPRTDRYRLDPPLNDWEIRMREEHPEYALAEVSNVTYGPDLNLSYTPADDDAARRIARRLTYYSPYLVPFSFSSPFRSGQVWSGPSIRTHIRTGPRAAVRVYLDGADGTPPLEVPARSASERGRIEFKAFDAIPALDLMAALFALVAGIALADDLPGRAAVPDRELHRVAGAEGWSDPRIVAGAAEMLDAARAALASDDELRCAVTDLEVLVRLLAERITPADLLVDHYRRAGTMYIPAPIPKRLFDI
ncbi:glutamate-cysteine ligase family protein [Millisia brevis]|uniref:glutamate-cysteine ligase family protein n=1 Tax=Millisia brevis TaxID=264148 RepID=UPI00082975D8|nr:glutamate-cysteine ligase family protein [Millisia brevis]